VESDRREEEKDRQRIGRKVGFVRLQAACAIAHPANLPLLTCIRLHRDNGYLNYQSLATILVGGYAEHVGDVPLAAVQRSSAHRWTRKHSALPAARLGR
jgi:hypothetical protein